MSIVKSDKPLSLSFPYENEKMEQSNHFHNDFIDGLRIDFTGIMESISSRQQIAPENTKDYNEWAIASEG